MQGPCQRFASNRATRSLVLPFDPTLGRAFHLCTHVQRKVLHGVANHRHIDGKDGVAGSIPAGAPDSD
jgi:hypothetical protein